MIESLNEYLSMLEAYSLFGKTARDYLFALILFVLISFGIRIFRGSVCMALRKLSKKTETDFDDRLIELIEDTNGLFFFAVALYFPLDYLVSLPSVDPWIDGVFLVIVVFEAIRFLQGVIGIALRVSLAATGGKRSKADNETTLSAMNMVVKIVLWITGILLVLSNLGFNINSLVASLGIGGVAVALAVQNILADIFSSFSIYFDKPFAVGDYIMIGQDGGVVKKIGLKTTRLCTLNGEELVVSNQELTSARLQNFKKMQKRRPQFNFGVTYETSAAKLRKIPEIVEKIVDGVEGCTFDRCSFESFGDFALVYKVVYFVETPDIKEYESDQGEINVAILEAFKKAKIEMAYPTHRVLMDKA